MFHYHFRSKDDFLRALLAQVYEDVFQGLGAAAAAEPAALPALRQGVIGAAAVLQRHRRTIARLWMDALDGPPVAGEFLRANAPRHLGGLTLLVARAQAEGALQPLPPLQCVAMLFGAVALPLVFAAGMVEVAMPADFQQAFTSQVATPQAVAQRVDLVLAALAVPQPLPAKAPRRTRRTA
jgi:AcrR family transcriptional regulator